jgi:glucose-1-phosphate cytidylyltransferase
MKVIILAGGFGTRLGEYTGVIPKPMVPIGSKPILWHIMNTYAAFGHKDFYVALGYKAEVIKDYFLNYRSLNSDFTVDLSSGETKVHQNANVDWKVTLVDTGQDTMTGGRVRRLRDHIGNEPFMLTYGDGVTDLDLDKLLTLHKQHGKMVTVTAVRPSARFGELDLEGNSVKSFKEKPQAGHGWVNGGYFIAQPEFFDLIDGDQTVLEKEPLERAAQMNELVAYTHAGFWQCMDTKRDKDALEDMWQSGSAPWRK